MAGFVATVPAAAEPEGLIVNDGWFPDIDLATLRNAIRIPGDITVARLTEAARYAIDSINREIDDWRLAKIADGSASLSEVPASQLDGESRLVMLYQRAIYSTVKADLTERYRDFDATGTGERRAKDMEPSIDEQRRNARWAVRDILGIARTTVELI